LQKLAQGDAAHRLNLQYRPNNLVQTPEQTYDADEVAPSAPGGAFDQAAPAGSVANPNQGCCGIEPRDPGRHGSLGIANRGDRTTIVPATGVSFPSADVRPEGAGRDARFRSRSGVFTEQHHCMKRQDPPSSLRNASALEGMVEYAAAMLQSGYPQDAERIARDVLSRRRNHPRASEILGLALLEQKRASDAIEPLERALRAGGGAAGETYLALALLGARQPGRALQLLQRAAQRRPPFPPAFFELGKLLRQERRLAEAEAVLRRGMEAAPGVAEFPLALGNVLLERGNMEGAKQTFAAALAIAPGHTAALQGLVLSLKDSGDFEAAAERAREAFARNPSDSEMRLLLATCLLELGRTEEATEHFGALLGASPKLFGKALKAYADVGRGRLWLRPSAAAAFFGVKPGG
jgi:tetratricopeptide (TPR) repeat protein